MTERHPWKPYLPQQCTILFLGSFPPAKNRWSMDFFYPNFQNDFWRIMGSIFYGDKLHFVLQEKRSFNLPLIKTFLDAQHIGLFDTAMEVERLNGTAADSNLCIVEPTDVLALLSANPTITTVVTTGQLATSLCRQSLGLSVEPRIGETIQFSLNERTVRFVRMPSSSRRLKGSVEEKAAAYKTLFETIN